MKFQEKLLKGRFLKRYKRFFADVELNNGEIVTSHCPNTGSMKDLLDFENAYISKVDDPKRKLKYTLQILEKNNSRVGVNTHFTNKLAVEAIENGTIKELANFDKLETEKKYGSQNSRIDILLHQKEQLHYVEVKNATLAEGSVALFPDSVTTRGQKHLQELTEMVKAGHRATMLYIVNRNNCNSFAIAKEIDPKYNRLLKKAVKAGVQVLVYACELSADEIKVTKKVRSEI